MDLKNYVGYLPLLADLRPKTPALNELDDLLMTVSQQYDESSCTNFTDEKVDELLLEASQLLVLFRVPDGQGHGSDTTASATALNAEVFGKPRGKVSFVCHKEGQHPGASIVVKKFCMPKKMQNNTEQS